MEAAIALLAEYENHKALLLADAHAPVVADAVDRLLAFRENAVLKVDLLKMSHHGSRRNNSKDLFALVPADGYLISTSGQRFGHPDVEAISRAIVYGGRNSILNFNYRSEENGVWDDTALMDEFTYKVRYPSRCSQGLKVEM